jgi:hypothetical protein
MIILEKRINRPRGTRFSFRHLPASLAVQSRNDGGKFVLVKRLLRKYGYPPDLQDAAVQNVLQQAELLSAEWAA